MTQRERELMLREDWDLYRQIGERVRLARQAQGLSQQDLADALGYQRPSVTNLESGRQRFLVSTFYRLCVLLKVTPADLLPAAGDAHPLIDVLTRENDRLTVENERLRRLLRPVLDAAEDYAKQDGNQ